MIDLYCDCFQAYSKHLADVQVIDDCQVIDGEKYAIYRTVKEQLKKVVTESTITATRKFYDPTEDEKENIDFLVSILAKPVMQRQKIDFIVLKAVNNQIAFFAKNVQTTTNFSIGLLNQRILEKNPKAAVYLISS